jgi:hypothetical protein
VPRQQPEQLRILDVNATWQKQRRGNAVNEDVLFSQLFGLDDIPHLGALCKRVREVRALSGREMAQRIGMRATRSITEDFEKQNRIGRQPFDRYLDMLQAADAVQMPIKPTQVQMLKRLYAEKGMVKVRKRTNSIAALNFEDIHPSNRHRPAALAELVDQLANEKRPALIMDDLWFVHVLNQTKLSLYKIAPDAKFLQGWEGWHSMAAKIPLDSPVRIAHSQDDFFVPPALVYFFESEYTYPYMFTVQVRALHQAMVALSRDHDADVHRWWRPLTTFSLPYQNIGVPRAVMVNGSKVFTVPRPINTVSVKVPGIDYPVNYTLVVWDILATSNPEVAADLQSNTRQRVYFACDYDAQHSFHVNSWPEVQRLMETWELC